MHPGCSIKTIPILLPQFLEIWSPGKTKQTAFSVQGLKWVSCFPGLQLSSGTSGSLPRSLVIDKTYFLLAVCRTTAPIFMLVISQDCSQFRGHLQFLAICPTLPPVILTQMRLSSSLARYHIPLTFSSATSFRKVSAFKGFKWLCKAEDWAFQPLMTGGLNSVSSGRIENHSHTNAEQMHIHITRVHAFHTSVSPRASFLG